MVDGWIHQFYRLLNELGFPDPIHAALVHIPMGLVVGAWIFAWLGVLYKRERLLASAYHCIVLALLFLFPVILFGIVDWRNFFGGRWLQPIKMKLILAGILFFFSLVAVVVGAGGRKSAKSLATLSTLCVITVVLLGWFGARLVYGDIPLGTPKTLHAGEKLFAANCQTCHAEGGNRLSPDRPLKSSPELKGFSSFLSRIRHPDLLMPAFPEARISEQEAKTLYDYIVNRWRQPGA